jgi:hypothetical protein
MVFCLKEFLRLQNKRKNYGTGTAPPLFSNYLAQGFVVVIKFFKNWLLTITQRCDT